MHFPQREKEVQKMLNRLAVLVSEVCQYLGLRNEQKPKHSCLDTKKKKQRIQLMSIILNIFVTAATF